jgi:hypothetical protein
MPHLKPVPLKYVVLSVLTGITALVTVCFHGSAWWIDSLAPNLCAGFLGSLITVSLVDRAVANRDRKIGRIAAAEAKRPIQQWLHEFATMLKVSQPTSPIPPPATLSELFSLEQLSNLDWLDIDSASPNPNVPWCQHVFMVIPPIREKLTQILAKYSASLSVEFIEAVEDLCNDDFVQILLDLNEMSAAQRQFGSLAPGLNGTAAVGAVFASKLLRLVAVFETVSNEQIPLPWSYTRDDVAPMFGSARLSSLRPPLLIVDPGSRQIGS